MKFLGVEIEITFLKISDKKFCTNPQIRSGAVHKCVCVAIEQARRRAGAVVDMVCFALCPLWLCVVPVVGFCGYKYINICLNKSKRLIKAHTTGNPRQLHTVASNLSKVGRLIPRSAAMQDFVIFPASRSRRSMSNRSESTFLHLPPL